MMALQTAPARRLLCEECGLPHTQARRLRVLRRCAEMEPAEIRDGYPHLWPNERLLYRDLAKLRGAK